jgi:hypothetical protein
MAAKKKEISTISGSAKSGTEVVESNARPPKAAGQKIEDDGSAAEKLVNFLAERKLI